MIGLGFVMSNQNNMNGECANMRCGFRFRLDIKPKAKFYDTAHKSWVCTSCAQEINRDLLARARRLGVVFKPTCINSEDALFLTLQNGPLT